MMLTGPPEVSQSNDGDYQISCNGANDGYIRMNITGGSGIYSYLWVGPAGYTATTEDISGLKPGTYVATVTDINGCILMPVPVLTLQDPSPLVVAYIPSDSSDGLHNIDCADGTGSADVTVTGGSEGNYSYEWSTTNGSGIVNGMQDQNALTAGTYQLIVTDINGCSQDAEIVQIGRAHV